MYTHIFSRNAINDESSGKTSRVWSDATQMNFSINKVNQQLVIEAFCYDSKGITDVYDVNRQFLLKLEKDEVEKLVSKALNDKLLKNLDIQNLASIDKVSALERDLQKAKNKIKALKKENSFLKNLISKAINILNEYNQ